MRCPNLAELPPPPAGRSGWPWSEETPPPSEGADWPLLSIVVPSYQQGRFIEETLRSVLLQGYPRLELVVCDDGSRDETPRVLERYADWLELAPEPEPRGMSRAINRGFERARGEIVTWIATDDVYLPGAFLAVARAHRRASLDAPLGAPAPGALIGGFQLIDAESRPLGEPIPARLDPAAPVDLSLAPPASWRLHQVGTFYTARGLEAAGRGVREDLDYVMDRDLLFRVARSCPIELLPQTLARFRLHPESKSFSSEQTLAFAREFATLQDDFLTGDPAADAERRRIRRHRLVKGYLRYGARGERLGGRVACLLRAALLAPRRVLTRDYAVRWLAALGVEAATRRLLGRDPRATLQRGIRHR